MIKTYRKFHLKKSNNNNNNNNIFKRRLDSKGSKCAIFLHL